MAPSERHILERCLAECKRRLTVYREVGNELQTALTEADMNGMLERLHEIYEREGAKK